MQCHFAKNAVIGFARIAGETAAVVANQPKYLAGSLSMDAADKIARFIRFCDSFQIPILSLVDCPGFLPGIREEHGGVIRHGAKILYAYAEATVSKVTVILRKAYGGAYVALNSKALGADAVFAWPNAEIAVMGASEAADVLFAKEIERSDDPRAAREEKIRKCMQASSPFTAARYGMVDDIIDRKTRKKLIQTFDMLRAKKKSGRTKSMEIYRFKKWRETSMNKKRLLEEFLELVQIDSETKHEAEICKVLKEKFAALGMDVVEDDTKPKTGHGAGNLVCTLPGTKEADTIYFTSTWIRSYPEKA